MRSLYDLTPKGPENNGQDSLLFAADEIEPWRREWQDMPEYVSNDCMPKYQILVNFLSEQDVEDFLKQLGSPMVKRQVKLAGTMWYPSQEWTDLVNFRYRGSTTK